MLAAKAWRLIHRDFRAKASISQVRPVANLAVSNANQVRQAVSRHVREEDRLGAIREDELGAFFFVERLYDALRGTESLRRQRIMPAESLVFANQQIGEAVTRQIDELQVRILPVQLRKRGKSLERLPVRVIGAFKESRAGPIKLYKVEFSIPGKIHQLLPSVAQRRKRGPAHNHPHSAELRQRDLLAIDRLLVCRTVIRFVVPTPVLLGQNTRDPFPVQVSPAVLRAVNA